MTAVPTTAATAATQADAIIRINISADQLTYFSAQALIHGLPDAESYIAHHLALTRDHTDGDEAIYLRRDECREIRRLLGGKINTGQRLVDMIQRLVRWKVGGQSVEISPTRQESIVWWAKSMQLELDDAVPKLVDQALGMLLKC